MLNAENGEIRSLTSDEIDAAAGGSNVADAWGAFALLLFGCGTGQGYEYERGTLGPALQRR